MCRWIALALLLCSALGLSHDETLRAASSPVQQQPLDATVAPLSSQPIPPSNRGKRFFLDSNGIERGYRPGVVLARFRNDRWRTVRVPPGHERATLAAMANDPAIETAELDLFLTRQFTPSDPEVLRQWHHQKLGSTNAWAFSLGSDSAYAPPVYLAIVDTPFQMNHPDLQPNTLLGWNLIRAAANQFETNGYFHSTITAGMAAAVVNNQVGVSGMANAALFPIDIGDEPSTSTMADAIKWAANHEIRVVNVSWDGAFSSMINDAGGYLKQRARGMLFMAGVNGSGSLNYPAHPHIYAVSMTDTNDQTRSSSGAHIDFAAPGWNIFSTTTNSTYEADSGTSYATPVLAGIAAWIMAVNPSLDPDQIESILRASSIDLGPSGWDENFGWGRIDFARVAEKTFATSPISQASTSQQGTVETLLLPGYQYRLLRSTNLMPGSWQVVLNAERQERNGRVLLRDPSPSSHAFYRIEITGPR